MAKGLKPSLLSSNPTVYSGVDIIAVALYQDRSIPIGNVHTLSYSIHREKFPVRRLGRSYPAGYVRGTRTIAGSMVFVNFNRAALGDLFKHFQYDEVDSTLTSTSILTDQLPPFDLMLFFRNEHGTIDILDESNPSISRVTLLGIDIVDEGGVYGVDEIYTETTMQYVARGIDLLRPVAVTKQVTGGITSFVLQDEEMTAKYEQLTQAWHFQNNPSDRLVFREGVNREAERDTSLAGSDE